MIRNFLMAALALVAAGQLALAVPAPAHAQLNLGNEDPRNLLGQTNLGGTPQDAGRQLPLLIGRIVRVLLSILGIIFLVLVVYAGFLWMTARGDGDKVSDAKSIITNAVIGLVVIFLAYALTGFIIDAVLRATTNQ